MTRGVFAGRQTTLQDHVTVAGIGVHSGAPATLTLHPAEADTGIAFLRCGTDGQPDRELSANYRAVMGRHFPAMTAVEVTRLVDPRAVVGTCSISTSSSASSTSIRV